MITVNAETHVVKVKKKANRVHKMISDNPELESNLILVLKKPYAAKNHEINNRSTN